MRLAPYDVVCALAAPFIAIAIRDPGLLSIGALSDDTAPLWIFSGVAFLSALVSFLVFRLSDGLSRFFSVHDVIAVSASVAVSAATTSMVLFTFTRLEGVPRSTPLIYAMVLGGLLILGRAFHRVLVTEQDKEYWQARPDQLRNVIIVGASRFSAIAVKLIASQAPPTTRVVGLLDERSEFIGRAINGVRVVAAPHELEAVLEEYEVHGVEIDQVLVGDGATTPSDDALEQMREICESRGVEFMTLADAFNLRPKPVAAAMEAAPAALAVAPGSSPYFVFRRIVDVVASLGLLAVLAPVTLLVCGLVLVDVGSPVLFWQERIGRRGRRFLLYKFRTYKAPFNWRGEAIAPDDRLSAIGRFIRRTRLDEIPQLLNILVGDMSLIGPRPLLPIDQPADPTLRLAIRPGITGWAQINGGNMVTPDEKDALDAWYIEHASLMIDIKIVIQMLVIALTGERLDKRAVVEALTWRNQHLAASAASTFDQAKRTT